MKALKEKVNVTGRFHVVHKRGGVVIDEFYFDNLVVDQGKTYMLSASLIGGTPITTWYIGLFSNNWTVVAGDLGSNFAVNAGEFVDYDEAARPEWENGAIAAKSVSNIANRATFTISSGVSAEDVYGAFFISTNVKGATGGTLWAAAQFDAPRSVSEGDELLVTYIANAP